MLPDFVTLTTTDGTALSMLSGREARQLRQDILPQFLPLQRWYGDKGKPIRSLSVQRLGTLGKPGQALTIVAVTTDRQTSLHFLPLPIPYGPEHTSTGAPLRSSPLPKTPRGAPHGAAPDA